MHANLSISDQIYKSDITISGYSGHIPTMKEKFGRNTKDLFLASMIDFQNDQIQKRHYKLDFKLQELFENGVITKQDLPIDSLVLDKLCADSVEKKTSNNVFFFFLPSCTMHVSISLYNQSVAMQKSSDKRHKTQV